MIFNSLSEQKPSYYDQELWQCLLKNYRISEPEAVAFLLDNFPHRDIKEIASEMALSLVNKVRLQKPKVTSIEHFLQTHKLSSQEGLAMMCLAEALLRIPDSSTKNKFIRDKVSQGDWESEKDHPWVTKLTNLSLITTAKILGAGQSGSALSPLTGLVRRFGGPVVRNIMIQAVKIMGQQFVMGETIEKALKRSEEDTPKGYRHSFDMLGEAAKTQADADRYFSLYKMALGVIGESCKNQENFECKPSLSIKLSAIHPRYEVAKRKRVMEEMVPRLLELAQMAKDYNIALTVDAEETERLSLSLEIFHKVFTHESLGDYQGLGLAVQAYQKRAPYVIDWLVDLAKSQGRKISIRLVKGAYWDSEIKKAQVLGLEDYPVYTRRHHTDLSYMVCARKMMDGGEFIFPQFATHNAYTLSSIYQLAQKLGVENYEFQRLHGMGEPLYNSFFEQAEKKVPCRIYAPVGPYEDLLAYLVRRLLENGANSNFVSQIQDHSIPAESLIQDPVEECLLSRGNLHPKIALPQDIFRPQRANSPGLDLSDMPTLEVLKSHLDGLPPQSPHVQKLIETSLPNIINRAHTYYSVWSKTQVEDRAKCAEKWGELLIDNYPKLLHILMKEGKKTMGDAIAEVREAVDFCYYYAQNARTLMGAPVSLPGPTGELNQLLYHGRGVFLCISPWNFPLAIFLGQVLAALVTGNTVLAKPAEATPGIAAFVLELAYKAGFPEDAVHLVHIPGAVVSSHILTDNRIAGVCFTGSTETAQSINQTLATRNGPIVPLIAETGGINAMIVDSSALPEQVVNDVNISAFQSVGQRCSALRVLCLQQEVAPKIIEMIKGTMAEIKVGESHWLETDVSCVISKKAKEGLEEYLEALKATSGAELLCKAQTPDDGDNSYYVAPQMWGVPFVKDVNREAFGPILHVVTFRSDQLDRLIDDINGLGYGLTFGLHSRLESTIQHVTSRIRAGNVYVNRSMIGAVVGSQPFGGEGLSGTGFKAGGPNYLLKFVSEKSLSQDTTAAGGNASLLAEI